MIDDAKILMAVSNDHCGRRIVSKLVEKSVMWSKNKGHCVEGFIYAELNFWFIILNGEEL